MVHRQDDYALAGLPLIETKVGQQPDCPHDSASDVAHDQQGGHSTNQSE